MRAWPTASHDKQKSGSADQFPLMSASAVGAEKAAHADHALDKNKQFDWAEPAPF